MCGKDYFKLLGELKMDGMERVLGNPKQFRVSSLSSFLLNVDMLNHQVAPVYMSQNRYSNGHMIIEKVFIEHEGKGPTYKDMTDAHSDMLKVAEWAEQNDVKMVFLQSGNKSFHTFILIKNTVCNGSNEQQYNRIYTDIGKGLSDKLKLKSIDFKCCEPKRLHRVPFATRLGQRTCTPIPLNMLSDLKGIIELTKQPVIKFGSYQTKGKEKEITELVKMTGTGGTTAPPISPTPHQSFYIPSTADEFLKYLDTILSQKCVLQDLIVPHPEHETRIAYVAWLNFLGFTVEEAIQLTDKVSEYSKWDDRENSDLRHYYVRHAIQRRYVPYSCKKLQEKGLKCQGNSCPLWRK